MVDRDGTSGQEGPAVDEMEMICRELGLPVTRMPVSPGRDNLLVGHANPRLVFCTHLDTVPPFIAAHRDATHVHGRGSADAKGIAVAMVHALLSLREEAAACCFVVGEETDHSGAKAVCQSPLRPELIVLGEPCGVIPVPAQKGLLKVRLHSAGRAAHSAYPELGSSAIHGLIETLHDLLASPFPHDPVLGPTTLNVGLIDGGLAANVTAPKAQAVLLFRCAVPVGDVLSELRQRLRGRADIEELSRTEPTHFLRSEAITLPAGATAPGAVPFNTDAGTLAPLGAKMMLLGPGDMRCCHGPDERLAIEDLAAGIAAYGLIGRHFFDNSPL